MAVDCTQISTTPSHKKITDFRKSPCRKCVRFFFQIEMALSFKPASPKLWKPGIIQFPVKIIEFGSPILQLCIAKEGPLVLNYYWLLLIY
jgi:hypothetical protein